MADIQTTFGDVVVVHRQLAEEEILYQGGSFAVYNIPTENLKASFALTNVVNTDNRFISLSQGNVMAVISGRIDNPKLRAWTYTLDGHDYYVLRLGTQGKTLVYDLTTGQWSWWSSPNYVSWRPSTGLNWKSSFDIPSRFGSNVVVGDDSYGVLWVLDPEKGLDDYILDDKEASFPRVATGQIPVSSRQALAIYNVDLSASIGTPSLTSNTVSLEYSDDQGYNYVTADEPQVSQLGGYNQEFSWRSLGQARAPGRLFRITDNGAFSRIDYLSINE